VSILTYIRGASLYDGVDFIAKSIDSEEDPQQFFEWTGIGNGGVKWSKDDDGDDSNVDALLASGNNISIHNNYIPSSSNINSNIMTNTNININSSSSINSNSDNMSGDLAAVLLSTDGSSTVSSSHQKSQKKNKQYSPVNHFWRLVGAVATLGSGCSLGPEGPSVEIGTGLSRLIRYYPYIYFIKFALLCCTVLRCAAWRCAAWRCVAV
jgi:hypothetical protein